MPFEAPLSCADLSRRGQFDPGKSFQRGSRVASRGISAKIPIRGSSLTDDRRPEITIDQNTTSTVDRNQAENTEHRSWLTLADLERKFSACTR